MGVKIHVDDQIKPIAEALGILIICWGWMEGGIDSLLGTMLRLSFPQGQAVLGSIDFREKIEILKTYGFATRHNDKWFSELETSLNKIDNVLRIERNRMIHDSWVGGPQSMIRINAKPKLRRPQSHQRVLEQDKIPFTSDEIEAFIAEVMAESSTVMRLHHDLLRDASPYK